MPATACMRMPAGALAGLRELAAAAAARSPPPLPPGAPRRTRCCTRPAAVAGAAPALRAPMAAMHSSGGEGDSTVSNGDAAASAARRDLPLPRDSQAALQHSISQLLDAGRPIVAAHLLAEEWAATSRCLDDEELSKRLVLALIEQVNTGAALEVLPMVTTSPEVVAAAIAAAAQRRSLQGVRALLTHAREAGASRGVAARPVWCAVIMALGALRRPHQARKAFADMRDAGAWQPGDTTTVNLLLNALAGDIALQFTRCNQLRQEGVEPDTTTINTLLKACMRARDVRRAELALRWMREDGVVPDEITYNTLIKVYSYSGDFDGVLGVWRCLGAAGFTPTPKLWGSLLLACSAAGQLEQAGIFWWEMKQLHSSSQAAEGQAGGGPSSTSVKAGSSKASGGRGQQRAGGKASSGSGVITLDNVCAMMTGCNDAGQYERALKVFEEARSLGVPLDARAFNLALRACHTPGKTLRHEQLMQAFALYDKMKSSGLQPDAYTYSTLFALCAAARQGHCALQLHTEMRKLGVQENVVALTALLKAVGSTPGPGMPQACLRIFRRMVRGPARLKPNQATYRTAIAALREAGALAEALALYQGMRRHHPADNSEFEGLTAVAAERALAAEDADLRRAVAEVCGITSAKEVDLHGMSGLEARAAVLCVLGLLQEQYAATGGVAHDATLITGRGLGSEGEPVVRQEVAALLDRLLLSLPPDALEGPNPGRIVIPRQLLCDALSRKMLGRQAAGGEQGGEPERGGSSGAGSGGADGADCGMPGGVDGGMPGGVEEQPAA